MKTTNQIPTVEQLRPRIAARKTMMPRLCLLSETTEVANLIWHAMKAEVEARYCQFTSDKVLENNMLEAAKLLTSRDDSRFGILLMGYPGTGKTTFAEALRKVIDDYNLVVDPDANYIQRYRVDRFSAKKLWNWCMKDPDYLNNISNSPVIFIDDLGEDPMEGMSFGNVLTPMIDLLEHRYERRLFTIATTNLTASDLSAKYGMRVSGRLNEMMLTLKFTGKDYRF